VPQPPRQPPLQRAARGDNAEPGLSVSPSALKAAEQAKWTQGESFESWEVAYKHLMELVEDGDVDQLVNGFIEKEQKNFSCFSYTIELNNEMEKMQQKIKALEVSSRLFVSLVPQLVLLGWSGVFLSHVSSIPAHIRAQLTVCHTGGTGGECKEAAENRTRMGRTLPSRS